MVTGPAAFENFKRLMAGLLAVPKAAVGTDQKRKTKEKKRAPSSKRTGQC
jgi:hypothetical protein